MDALFERDPPFVLFFSVNLLSFVQFHSTEHSYNLSITIRNIKRANNITLEQTKNTRKYTYRAINTNFGSLHARLVHSLRKVITSSKMFYLMGHIKQEKLFNL